MYQVDLNLYHIKVIQKTKRHCLISLSVPGQPIIKGVLPRFSLVAISWNPPTQSGGPITAYQIEYKIDDAIHDSTVLEDSTLGRFHLVQGLGGKVGSMHEVRVRARTEAGYGPYSERVSFVFKSIGELAWVLIDKE